MSLFTALERRVAADGARPLLTWYLVDPSGTSTAARVEFSAITLANWADKTVNLLADLGWDDDGVAVGAPVLAERPGHWVGAVWALATWQAGGRLLVAGVDALDDVDVAVLGPSATGPVAGADTIACSLHPLGLALPDRPDGVLDFHEVLSQPDLHSPAVADPDEVWLSVGDADVTGADLAASPDDGRVLVVPNGPQAALTVLRALASAIVGGGSVVVVDGTANEQYLADVARAEHAVSSSLDESR
ncbi:TIGR03089 family protein [Aestuariimicrobium ganziense]|uniref:TIGR03089 family protein n=1 Tax=Aestuariimicrobium ganziense TaxID=2773677 RepID=UPI0019435EBB|nr:TIGR03089 family protein [Aestuariimicrobium ganziense]